MTMHDWYQLHTHKHMNTNTATHLRHTHGRSNRKMVADTMSERAAEPVLILELFQQSHRTVSDEHEYMRCESRVLKSWRVSNPNVHSCVSSLCETVRWCSGSSIYHFVSFVIGIARARSQLWFSFFRVSVSAQSEQVLYSLHVQ